jgi:hypothetical protein
MFYYREGQMEGDKVHGIGRKFRIGAMDDEKMIADFPDEIFYISEGQFKDDLLEGFGRHVLMNGHTLIGNFKGG